MRILYVKVNFCNFFVWMCAWANNFNIILVHNLGKYDRLGECGPEKDCFG